LSEVAFEKPFSVLHEWLSNMFCMSLQACKSQFVCPGFMPFGLGQWFVPIRGCVLLLGVKAEHVPGHAFSQKINMLLEEKPDNLYKMVKDHGFCIQCEVGAAGWVPPGYITIVLALGGALWFKWSSMCSKPEPGSAEVKQVLSSTTQMVSSFPVLAANYRDWLRYLEVVSKGST
jgi:hypothetical protein